MSPFLISLGAFCNQIDESNLLSIVKTELFSISTKYGEKFENLENSGQLKFEPDAKVFEVDGKP